MSNLISGEFLETTSRAFLREWGVDQITLVSDWAQLTLKCRPEPFE